LMIPKRTIAVFTEKRYYPFYRACAFGGESSEIISCEEAFDWVHRGRAELAIIDCGFRIELGLKLLREIKKASPDTVALIITEVISEERAIEAFHSGVRYYLHRPFAVTELRKLVNSFLKLKRETREKRSPYIDQAKTTREAAPEITSGKPAPLLRAVQYIEDNLTGPIDLGTCAKEANLSKYYFCRLFRRHFGMSPMRFILLLRVGRAKVLLRQDDFNITEVALDVGFKDNGSFSRAFKKVTGYRPRDYRRLLKAG